MKEIKIKRDNIKKSSFFNITIKLLTYLIPLVLMPYLYRVLGVTLVGTYDYQYAFVTYFMLVAAFGFTEYGTKRISTATNDVDEMSKRFWSILYSKILLGLLSLGVYFVLVYCGVFGPAKDYQSYSILSLFIVSSILDITYLYQGIENFKSIALRTLLVKIINLILIFCLVKTSDDFIIYVIIMSVCMVFSSLIMFLPLYKYVKRPSFDLKNILMDLKGSLVFFISALAISLYTTMQKTILGALTNETEVGYFSSAMKIKDVITAISYAIIPIFYSRASYLIAMNKEDEAKNIMYKCFNAIYDFIFPATCGLICIANVFVPLYFSKEAEATILLLQVSSLALVFIAMSSILNYVYFMPNNKIKITNFIYLGAALFNFAITFLLVHFFSSLGASIAVVLTEAFVATLSAFFSYKFVNFKTIFKLLFKPFIASLIMMGMYFLLNYFLVKLISPTITMFILIIFSMLLYYGLLLLFKDNFAFNFTKNIMSSIKNKFKKNDNNRP